MNTQLYRPALILRHTHVALPGYHSAIRRFNDTLRATSAEHYVSKDRAYERAEQLVTVNGLSGAVAAGFCNAGSLDY